MNQTAFRAAAAALLAACALTGCIGGASESSPVRPEGESGGDRLAPSRSLTVATIDNYFEARSYTENLPVWREVERKTGIRIDWEVTPRSRYTETMGLRLAKGRELPDIFLIPEENPGKAAAEGHIIPLDELIAANAPHIAAFLKENPDIDKRMRSPDGKIYAISSVVTGAAYTDPYGLMIRKDWLDRLGLREPTTLDEWYAVLKAFKEQDPNGNGIQDEIPLLPDLGFRGLGLFGSAIGAHFFYSNGYYPDEEGIVRYEWQSPEAKLFVEWLGRLYREGLLAADYLTRTEESYLNAITRGQVGVTNGFLNYKSKYEAGSVRAGDRGAIWTMVVPPAGPGGKGQYEIYGPISSYYGISKDCKDPELAIRWLDYIYASEEGSRLLSLGIEGWSYTMKSGKAQFLENASNNPDRLDMTSLLRSLGAMPTLPWIRTEEGPFSLHPKAFMEYDPRAAEQAAKVKPYLVESIPLALPSTEEREIFDQLRSPLHNYVNLALARFVAGSQPIDWKQFNDTLASLGIDKLLGAKQTQYNRYKGTPNAH